MSDEARPVQPNPDGPGAAQATAAVPDDPQTADLLRRHGAGEKLTPAEYGKLGWFARTRQKLFGAGSPGDGQGNRPAPLGNAVALAPVSPAEASPASLVPPDVDAGLCRRTAAALLERGDAFAVGWIEREASRSGATGQTLDRFRAAAGLSKDDKRLLVEISPDVCRELGLDPRKFCVWTALGVLGFHTVNLWQCVNELRELRKAKPQPRQDAAPDLARGPGPIPSPRPDPGAVQPKSTP